jgi:hypothetical protein
MKRQELASRPTWRHRILIARFTSDHPFNQIVALTMFASSLNFIIFQKENSVIFWDAANRLRWAISCSTHYSRRAF